MKTHTLTLSFAEQQILLTVESPSGIPTTEDYCEVNFQLADGKKYRAVFFLLPENTSDDPCVALPAERWAEQWKVPVRWEDNTMLYLPALNDDALLAAMTFVLERRLESEAFEDEEDIASNDANS